MPSIYLYEQKEKIDYYYEFGGFVIVKVSRAKNCSEFKKYGYKCYRHQVSRVLKTIHYRVGNVKFYNHSTQPGKHVEIKLNNGSGSDCSSKYCRKWETNIYVYFYGEDPRPLLLCYNGWAYAPKDKGGYCSEWCSVAEVKLDVCACGCPGSSSRPDDKLLGALTRVSQFMNPVRLCLGKDAYQKLDPKHGQQQQQPVAPSGQSEGPKQWSYTIHAESRPPICVRVTGVDLRCYKQYVHRPAIHGFRLGRVTYAEAKDGEGGASPGQQGGTCPASQAGAAGNTGGACPVSGTPGTPTTTSAFCFEYDSSRQLWSVCVYYYMYDFEHNWPLVVELGFKGQGSEFYRLCCTGDNGAGSAAGQGCQDKKLKWVRMTHDTVRPATTIANSSCANGATDSKNANGAQGDLCQPCNTGAGDTQSDDNGKKMCAGDAEFAKEAERLQNEIDKSMRDVPVFTLNYLSLQRELSDLIEQRAYEIRNRLNLEYGDKKESDLILETSSRCWEDWPLGYMVGGGFLGVAAGGGWKITVAVLGMLVKL